MGGTVDDRAGAQAAAASAYGHLPLSFGANQGQADPAVDFVPHGQGYSLGRAGALDGVAVDQAPTVLGIELQGADPHPRALGEEPLPGTANYFIGNDPSRWYTGIPTDARPRYQDIYPGIDLVYYGHQGQLEDDSVVAPGVDPHAIRLAFEGADGVEVTANGMLMIHTGDGDVTLQPPALYQEVDEVRQPGQGERVE